MMSPGKDKTRGCGDIYIYIYIYINILTMAFTGKFVYMAHHLIVLRLNPFVLRVDRKEWWFEHSVLKLQDGVV